MPAGGSTRRGYLYRPDLDVPRPRATTSGRVDSLLLAEGLAFLALIVVVATIIGSVLPESQASAASVAPTFATDPGAGTVDATVTASGSGYGHMSVQLLWDGSPAGMPTVEANGNGAFKTTFRVPSAAALGSHSVTATSISSSGRGNARNGSGGSSTVGFAVLSATPTSAPTATAAPTITLAPTTTPIPTAAPTTTPTVTATAQPTPSASPPPSSSAPAPSPVPSVTPSGFVARCGISLCLNGSAWYLYGAAGRDVSSARAMHLNTIRITNWLHEEPGSNPFEESRWQIVDAVLDQARGAGLHAILDLSTYRNFLFNSGLDPYTVDWSNLVTFVATRRNTVNGVAYKDDPTIALVGFAGEVDGITGNTDPRTPTTSQLTGFYQRTFSQWRAIDDHHLLEPGGLLHFGWDSGIDWRTIFSYSDVCSIHNYSQSDSDATPTVASYCAGIGRPWITEEFGWSQKIGDALRAQNYQSMYNLQKGNRAAGAAFWYVGSQLLGVNGVTDTYDVNSQTPLTWNAVVANAP